MLQNLEHVQIFTSIALVTLIWIIQVVHYPMFKYMSEEQFPIAMKQHQNRISLIVIPLMIAELICTAAICFLKQDLSSYLLFLIISLIWISTFLVQVPIHNSLSDHFKIEKINELVKTNWMRTGLWTLKVFLVLFYY